MRKPAPANRAGEGYDLELGGAENRVGYTRDADIEMPAMAPHSMPRADTIVFYATCAPHVIVERQEPVMA